MRFMALVAACVGAAAAVGCGGGSTSFTDGSGSSGGFSFQGNLVTAPAALVATDVNSDGKTDLVALDRAGLGDVKCYENLGNGTYADASAKWAANAEVLAVKDSCDASNDAALQGDMGVHLIGCPKGGQQPFALMHLGEGVTAPAGPAVVTGIEPASGPTKSLAWVEGTDLAAVGEAPTVTFDGVAANVLLAFSDYVLVVVPDALPLGPVDVVLTRGGVAAAAVSFTVTAATSPTLTSVEPTSVSPGTVAVLHGSNLGSPFDAVTVSFAGTPAQHAVALLDLAFAVVPAGAISGPVTITVNGVVSNGILVTVGSLPTPAISALVPASASPGSLVRIEGTGLFVIGQPIDVTFNGPGGGVAAAIFGLDGSSVTAIVPPGATDGNVVITVGGRASPGVPFDVVNRAAPSIASISPSSASAGQGITIKGTDLYDMSAWVPNALPPYPFFGDVKVTVGGKDAWFVIPTQDGLDVFVPFGAVSGDVVVTVNGVASNHVPITVN